jgi:hypothetical protein
MLDCHFAMAILTLTTPLRIILFGFSNLSLFFFNKKPVQLFGTKLSKLIRVSTTCYLDPDLFFTLD